MSKEATPVAIGVPVAATGNAVSQAPSTNAPPVAHERARSWEDDCTDPSDGTPWSTGLFECFSGKDCCTFNGCIQNWLCSLCVYSSALAHTEFDIAGFMNGMGVQMRCFAICCGLCCEVCPCQCLCLRAIARLEVARQYGIKEDIFHSTLVSCCCCCCADGQVQNEIMQREALKYGCAQVCKSKSAMGSPQSAEMARG